MPLTHCEPHGRRRSAGAHQMSVMDREELKLEFFRATFMNAMKRLLARYIFDESWKFTLR